MVTIIIGKLAADDSIFDSQTTRTETNRLELFRSIHRLAFVYITTTPSSLNLRSQTTRTGKKKFSFVFIVDSISHFLSKPIIFSLESCLQFCVFYFFAIIFRIKSQGARASAHDSEQRIRSSEFSAADGWCNEHRNASEN